MSGEWTDVTLGDLAKVESGFAFKSRDWVESGVPVVKIQNVRGGRIDLTGCSFVSAELAASVERYRLSPGDVLVTMSGEIGSVGIVRSNEPMMQNQRVGRVRLNGSKPDPALLRYIGYSLQTRDAKAQMELMGYGAAQPNISPALLASLPISLPPQAIQRRIIAVLDALEDLIENLVRRKGTLSSMRDLLLPGLVTGDINVSTLDVDIVAEGLR